MKRTLYILFNSIRKQKSKTKQQQQQKKSKWSYFIEGNNVPSR